MADEKYTFTQARARLEDIVVQVRKKDCSLEQSLELLEEGVRLANVCTELSDRTEWASAEATMDAAAVDVDTGGGVEQASADSGALETRRGEAVAEEDAVGEPTSEGDLQGADPDAETRDTASDGIDEA